MPDKSQEIGGFWLRESRQGKKYMSGQLTMPDGSKIEVVMFRNEHKQEGERTPDYRLYRSQPREEKQSGGWGDDRTGSAGLDEEPPWQ